MYITDTSDYGMTTVLFQIPYWIASNSLKKQSVPALMCQLLGQSVVAAVVACQEQQFAHDRETSTCV